MDLSGLSNITASATALSNLALVSPQKTVGYRPQTPGTTDLTAAPPALLFHYNGEERIDLESDITDHYVEDNTAVTDQISLKPETVTVRGFIGELNNVPPYGLQTLKAAADKLSAISAYAPAVSVTALEAYNAAFEAYQVAANAIDAGVNAWNFLSGGGGENVIGDSGLGKSFDAATGNVSNWQTRQQVAFQQFYGYWRARTLFTVQTPWAVLQNMAISRLQAIQEDGTTVVTDFVVTFKMIRMADLGTSDGSNLQGRAGTQASGLVQGGTSSPTTADTGFLDKLTSFAG